MCHGQGEGDGEDGGGGGRDGAGGDGGGGGGDDFLLSMGSRACTGLTRQARVTQESVLRSLVLFLTSSSCHDRQNPTNHHVTTKQWTSSCEPLETQATATTTGKDHACVGSQLLPLRVQIMNAVNDDSRV